MWLTRHEPRASWMMSRTWPTKPQPLLDRPSKSKGCAGDCHTAAVATLVVGSATGAITADPKHEAPELAGWEIKNWADLRCSPSWPNQSQGLERRLSHSCKDDGPSEAALSSLHRLHRPTPQREASDQRCPGCITLALSCHLFWWVQTCSPQSDAWHWQQHCHPWNRRSDKSMANLRSPRSSLYL